MKFRKQIVSTGVYNIPGHGIVEITPDRLQHWANQFSQMQTAGFRVPAPWGHSEQSLPMSIGDNGTLPNVQNNAGFWDRLWVENDSLWGTVEVPREEDASKVGTSVQETSIYVRPQFTDSKSNNWEDAIMHVALVTHPVELGQPNFTPEAEGLALSMSLLSAPLSMAGEMQAMTGEGGVPQLLKALRECQIDLPEDTTSDNLYDRLLVALRQKKASESPEDQTTRTPPEGADEQPAPVAMSQTTPPAAPPVADETKTELAAAKQTISFLMSHLGDQTRQTFVSRRNELIKTGRCTEDYAKAHIDPLITGFQMSFGDDGKRTSSPVDSILTALESMPSMLSNSNHQLGIAMSLPAGLHEEPLPSNGSVSEEEADALALQFLKNTGHIAS